MAYPDELVTQVCGVSEPNVRRLITAGFIKQSNTRGFMRTRHWDDKAVRNVAPVGAALAAGFAFPMAYTLVASVGLTFDLAVGDLVLEIFDGRYVFLRGAPTADGLVDVGYIEDGQLYVVNGQIKYALATKGDYAGTGSFPPVQNKALRAVIADSFPAEAAAEARDNPNSHTSIFLSRSIHRALDLLKGADTDD